MHNDAASCSPSLRAQDLLQSIITLAAPLGGLIDGSGHGGQLPNRPLTSGPSVPGRASVCT